MRYKDKLLLENYAKWLEVARIDDGKSIGDYNKYISRIPDDVETVLCIGSGAGGEISALEKAGYIVTAMTLNKEDAVGEDVYEMDMHRMYFSNGTFDLIWAKDVFEHSISHIIAIGEYARVSKHYVYIIVPGERKWGKSTCHFICPTPMQMVNIGRKAGLELISERPCKERYDEIQTIMEEKGGRIDFDVYERDLNEYLFTKGK